MGKGYSAAFVANYDGITRRLGRGETIEVVEGPDDICAPLAEDEAAHCHGESVSARDAVAAGDIAELLGRAIIPGLRIEPTAQFTSRLREAFAARRIRTACEGCEWSGLCTAVAESGFEGARVTGDGAAPAGPGREGRGDAPPCRTLSRGAP